MFSRKATLIISLSAAVCTVAVADSLYPQPVIPMVHEPEGLTAVDLDGDGLLDLVSANFGNSDGDMAILMGHGDGTFAPEVTYEPCGPSGGGPLYAAPGDFDENGTVDLAVACGWSGVVAILLGNGDGTFAPAVEYGEADNLPFIVQTGDFNNDDHLDLMVANYANGGVEMHLGNGDGTFGPAVGFGGGSPYTVAVGDFNGDDNDDFARPGGGNIQVHLGNGDATFAPALLHPGVARHLVAVDLNGDQILDLVAAEGESAQQISVMLGNGDGTFSTTQQYPTDGGNPNYVAVADFNGDGLVDIAVNNRNNFVSVSMFYGTGGGQFAPAVGIDNVRAGGDFMVAADFDRDGALDLARPCHYCDDLNILFGDGSGGLITPLREDIVDDASDVIAVDLNGDGRPDLAVSNEGPDEVSVVLAEAAGTFGPDVRYPTRRDPSAIVVGEFTGDAIPDLVTSNRAHNNLNLLSGTGGGAFSSAIGPTVGAGPADLVVGDFDEDDQDDLAVANGGSNDVSILLGLGDGTFALQPLVPVGTGPTAIVVADFDGDDHVDLAVTNEGSNDISLVLGTGSATFSTATSLPVGTQPTDLAVGDIDGDDILDLAVVHDASQDLRTYFGNGDGSFTVGQTFPIEWFPTTEPLTVMVSDLNRDELVDVCVGADGRVEVFINAGGGALEREAAFAARSQTVATGVAGADFNGDSLQDLVVSSVGSEFVTVLLNQSGPDALSLDADKSTVVWPAVIGALSYNVYRGDVSDLVDTDGDGLPDGGYGICMTALDMDSTDTFFDDPEMPLAGGFFYLRSAVDSGGDGGIGSTSGGLPRVPTVACP